MLHLSPYLTCGFHLSLRSNRLVNLPTLYASYLKKSSFWINMTVQKISRKMRALVWEENLMRVSYFLFDCIKNNLLDETYRTKLSRTKVTKYVGSDQNLYGGFLFGQKVNKLF